MPIETHYLKGGKKVVKPVGYPSDTCFDATRPYLEDRLGSADTRRVDSEAQVRQRASQSIQERA